MTGYAQPVRLFVFGVMALLLILLMGFAPPKALAQTQPPFSQQLGSIPEQLGAERVPCRVYGVADAQACFEYRSPLVIYAMAAVDRTVANLPDETPWTQQPNGDYQKRYLLNTASGLTLDVTLRQLDPYTVFGVLRYPTASDET